MKKKENQKITKIKDIKCSGIEKKIIIKGTIYRIGKVRPKIIRTDWECEDCGEKSTVIQNGQTIEKPYTCDCGNKTKFIMLGRKIQDYQQNIIDDDTGSINIILEGKIVKQTAELNCNDSVIVNGIVNIPISQNFVKSPLISDFIIFCKKIEKYRTPMEIMAILRIMKELQEESPDKIINTKSLISHAEEEEGVDPAKAEEIIEYLRKDGVLFEPKSGYLKMV